MLSFLRSFRKYLILFSSGCTKRFFKVTYGKRSSQRSMKTRVRFPTQPIKFFKLKCKIPPESVGKNSSFNSKSFFAAFYVIGWFSLYSYLQLKINSFSPQEVNNYPNYVFMYLYQLVAAEILRLIIIITHYIVNNKLRDRTSIFLRKLMSNIVNLVNNFVQKDVYSCNL